MHNRPLFVRLAQVIQEAIHASLDVTEQEIYRQVYQEHRDVKSASIELAVEEAVVRQRLLALVLRVRDEVYFRIQADRDLQEALEDLLANLEVSDLRHQLETGTTS